jgi:hypothetical protein
MAITVRMATMHRDVEVLLDDILSPQARSRHIADFARDQFRDAQATNRQALGRVPPHESFVDGRQTDDFDSVRPDGQITITFQLIGEVLEWIGEQLVLASPVLTGAYSRTHAIFADGIETTGKGISEGSSFVFLNTRPYARKIELGQSDQAPEGVYEAVAAVAANRFGNIAKIAFTYRAVIGMRAVDQDLAASLGGNFGPAGFFEPRAATAGSFESTLGTGAHNRSELRYPAIVVTL